MQTPSLKSALLATISLIAVDAAYATTLCNNAGPVTYNFGTGTNGLSQGGTAQAGCEQSSLVFNHFQVVSPDGTEIDAQFSGIAASGIGLDLTSGAWNIPSAATNAAVYDAAYIYSVGVDRSLDPSALMSELSIPLTTGDMNLGTPIDNDNQILIATRFCTGQPTPICNYGTANYGELDIYFNSPGGYTYFDCYADCPTQQTPVQLKNLPAFISLDLGAGTQNIGIEQFVGIQSAGANIRDLQTVFDVTGTTVAAPEPASWLLISFGLTVCGLLARRRSASAF